MAALKAHLKTHIERREAGGSGTPKFMVLAALAATAATLLPSFFPASQSHRHFPPCATQGHRALVARSGAVCGCQEVSVLPSTPAICTVGVGT